MKNACKLALREVQSVSLQQVLVELRGVEVGA